MNEKLQGLLKSTQRTAEQLDEDIVRTANEIIRDMRRVIEQVSEGVHVNSADVNLSAGLRIDTACARRQDAYAQIGELEYMLKDGES